MSRSKIEVFEAEDRGSIKYYQPQNYSFEPALSCDMCSERDTVTVINIPLFTLINVIVVSVSWSF